MLFNFFKLFGKKINPHQKLSAGILLDCIDLGYNTLERATMIENDLNTKPVPIVFIQIEDYRGCLALPHYGFNSVD